MFLKQGIFLNKNNLGVLHIKEWWEMKRLDCCHWGSGVVLEGRF